MSSGFRLTTHLCWQGYKAQCGPVLARVAALVAQCEARQESLVVEGVHLSTNAVFRIVARHACVVPFLVCIRNEAKHRERFAVSALLLPKPRPRAHLGGTGKGTAPLEPRAYRLSMAGRNRPLFVV